MSATATAATTKNRVLTFTSRSSDELPHNANLEPRLAARSTGCGRLHIDR